MIDIDHSSLSSRWYEVYFTFWNIRTAGTNAMTSYRYKKLKKLKSINSHVYEQSRISDRLRVNVFVNPLLTTIVSKYFREEI